MRELILCSIVAVLSFGSSVQALGALTPNLSPAVKESSEGFSFFLNLWEYSLKVDLNSTSPTERNNLEPKTLLLPGDYSMAHLVPQDGSHPLFMDDPKHTQLRREFILDHLVLNVMSKSNPEISTPEGLTERTLSGKPITIRQDPSGDLTVAGVRVKKTVTLPDDCHIYVLETPLFDQTQKVRDAFDKLHKISKEDALGPPLDIPGLPLSSEVRAPAPPPRGFASPPASPTEEELRTFNKKRQPPPIPLTKEGRKKFKMDDIDEIPAAQPTDLFEPEEPLLPKENSKENERN